MLVAGAFLGMFVNGDDGGYGALMAEAYPTEGCNRTKCAV